MPLPSSNLSDILSCHFLDSTEDCFPTATKGALAFLSEILRKDVNYLPD